MDMTWEGERSPVSIRRVGPDDYDDILALWSAAGLPVRATGRESRAAFVQQIEPFGDLYLAATDGDRIVGVVLGTHDGRRGWINRLAVLPEYQRRGIAATLVTACDTAIRAKGIEIVAALIEPENAASIALFETLGYRAEVPVVYYRKLSRPDA